MSVMHFDENPIDVHIITKDGTHYLTQQFNGAELAAITVKQGFRKCHVRALLSEEDEVTMAMLRAALHRQKEEIKELKAKLEAV